MRWNGGTQQTNTIMGENLFNCNTRLGVNMHFKEKLFTNRSCLTLFVLCDIFVIKECKHFQYFYFQLSNRIIASSL